MKENYTDILIVSEKNLKPQIVLSYGWLNELGFGVHKSIRVEAFERCIILSIPKRIPMEHPLDFNEEIQSCYKNRLRVLDWLKSCPSRKVVRIFEEHDHTLVINTVLYDLMLTLLDEGLIN